jgi:hypothetical protein
MGIPGTGKTLWATVLAACVSRGYMLPGQDGTLTESPGEPGITLFVAAEDDISDTLKPRLRQAGADESKVKFIDTIINAQGRERYFTLDTYPSLKQKSSAGTHVWCISIHSRRSWVARLTFTVPIKSPPHYAGSKA